MSIFQDKKTIVHISCEIIVLGTMVYFFNNKTNQLLIQNRQNEKSIDDLRAEISELKKKIGSVEPNLNEMRYLIESLENVKRESRNLILQIRQMQAQQFSIPPIQPIPQPQQPSLQKTRQKRPSQPASPPASPPTSPPTSLESSPEPSPLYVQPGKRVQIDENVLVIDFESSFGPKKSTAKLEVMDEEEDLDKELESELKELED
jgi:hypothetical protein